MKRKTGDSLTGGTPLLSWEVLFALVLLLVPLVHSLYLTVKIPVFFALNRYEISAKEAVQRRLRHEHWNAESLSKDIKGVTEVTEFYVPPSVNYHGWIQKCLGRRFIPQSDSAGGIYKMDNGQLVRVVQKIDVADIVEKCVSLKRKLDETGTRFLYVQAPDKVCRYQPQLPRGVCDACNENADDLLGGLRKAGIDTLDLREELHRQGKDHAAFFFLSDRHWIPEAGLWASSAIAETLRRNDGFDSDSALTRSDSFNRQVFPRSFQGTEGELVGRFYVPNDDISMLTPNFETNFEVVTRGAEGEETRSGDWLRTMFRADLWPGYRSYMGKRYPYFHSRNLNLPSGKKVLLVHDSLGMVVVPFLSLSCGELLSLDLRCNESIYDFSEILEEERPDAVVILYSPREISYAHFQDNEHQRMFDFE